MRPHLGVSCIFPSNHPSPSCNITPVFCIANVYRSLANQYTTCIGVVVGSALPGPGCPRELGAQGVAFETWENTNLDRNPFLRSRKKRQLHASGQRLPCRRILMRRLLLPDNSPVGSRFTVAAITLAGIFDWVCSKHEVLGRIGMNCGPYLRERTMLSQIRTGTVYGESFCTELRTAPENWIGLRVAGRWCSPFQGFGKPETGNSMGLYLRRKHRKSIGCKEGVL
jgi:hypothetical protein